MSTSQENIHIVRVKIADYRTAAAPAVLVTNGLGSCVGLSLYDERTRIGGLAHIMLPEGGSGIEEKFYPRYANTAIRLIVDELEKLGSSRVALTAKLAGGASMFSNVRKDGKGIGERNVEAVYRHLHTYNIAVSASDTGGDYGRSIEFRTATGEMLVRSLRHGDTIL